MLNKINDDVLGLFFLNPTTSFHVRAVAKKQHISTPTASYKLKQLAKTGLLIKEAKANLLLFRANLENPSFIVRKRIYNLRQLYSSGIVEALNAHYAQPEAVVLFGSYARGEDIERSDIDIAVTASIPRSVALGQYEKLLHRKIQLLELKPSNRTPELINSLANGIVLSGYLKVT